MRYLLKAVDNKSIVLTRGRTFDNADNLPPSLLEELQRRYGGTRIGRQELEGELLEDIEGALWTYEMATRNRCEVPDDLERIVVAVDPATTGKESSNETGIIVAGKRGEEGFLLEDLSMRGMPLEWAAKVVEAYHRWEADCIVVETNQGGDMIKTTIQVIDPDVPVKGVHASRGKWTRAEPVSALYEQNRIYHCGDLHELEEQMASWTPEQPSPDRLDAMVWAITDLILGHKAAPTVVPFGSVQSNPWTIS
tara:strand:+ start:304 stop:1056 length:753 start_codon:yes stop_codon:yes gene_type:complete